MLNRDYFFEFAGMPKSGKTTTLEIISHYLKRKHYAIEEYHGGGRYSPIDKSAITSLNLWLACKAVSFTLERSEREKTSHKIFLMDRGLIDRCIFTEALVQRQEVDPGSAQIISNFLTLPELMCKIDAVFIFRTSPELSIQREYTKKLLHVEGRVMNTAFLSILRSAATTVYNRTSKVVLNSMLIDTEVLDQQVEKTAQLILDSILDILGEKSE